MGSSAPFFSRKGTASSVFTNRGVYLLPSSFQVRYRPVCVAVPVDRHPRRRLLHHLPYLRFDEGRAGPRTGVHSLHPPLRASLPPRRATQLYQQRRGGPRLPPPHRRVRLQIRVQYPVVYIFKSFNVFLSSPGQRLFVLTNESFSPPLLLYFIYPGSWRLGSCPRIRSSLSGTSSVFSGHAQNRACRRRGSRASDWVSIYTPPRETSAGKGKARPHRPHRPHRLHCPREVWTCFGTTSARAPR